MRLRDGDYQIELEIELDRGYGIEATSNDVMIYVVNGEIDETIAYGIHDTTGLDIDWNAELTDDECLKLIQKYHAYAIDDSADLDEIADQKLSLAKGK